MSVRTDNLDARISAPNRPPHMVHAVRLKLGRVLRRIYRRPVLARRRLAWRIQRHGDIFLGFATAFLLLAKTEPGRTFLARIARYVFAAAGGYSASSMLGWLLWASGMSIAHSTGAQLADAYWIGPATLVYSVMVWIGYRQALARERR